MKASSVVAFLLAPHNKALHQTRRGGAAGFAHCRPVVEARLAGEGRCWTDQALLRR